MGLEVGRENIAKKKKKTFSPFKSSLRMDGATFAKARIYFVKRMYPSRSINTHRQIYANKVVFYTRRSIIIAFLFATRYRTH